MKTKKKFYRSYKTHNYCSRCGGDGWFPKDIERCPIHGQLLRKSARFTKKINDTRWEKAY